MKLLCAALVPAAVLGFCPVGGSRGFSMGVERVDPFAPHLQLEPGKAPSDARTVLASIHHGPPHAVAVAVAARRLERGGEERRDCAEDPFAPWCQLDPIPSTLQKATTTTLLAAAHLPHCLSVTNHALGHH